MLTVNRTDVRNLLAVWTKFLPQIRRGLQRAAGDTLTEAGLFHDVARGDVVLWVLVDEGDMVAAVFLRIDQRERGKALVILEVVGNGSGGQFRRYTGEMLTLFREYGDMIGAYTIESYSRRGAARELMRHGCRPKAFVMELRDERRPS